MQAVKSCSEHYVLTDTVTTSLDLGTDKSKYNACKTEHSIISFKRIEIKMTALSVKLFIRDPYSDSKATLCHFGDIIAVGFDRPVNAEVT